jgi:hypothetical protein
VAAIEEVIAVAAFQLVVAGSTKEPVVAGVADEVVEGAVPPSVEVAGSGQSQILQVAPEGIGDGALHPVIPLVVCLVDLIADIIDNVGVIVTSAGHEIAAGAAIQQIAAFAAEKPVIPLAAEKLVVSELPVENVIAGKTFQDVVAPIADYLIGQLVAGSNDGGSGKGEVLDVG